MSSYAFSTIIKYHELFRSFVLKTSEEINEGHTYSDTLSKLQSHCHELTNQQSEVQKIKRSLIKILKDSLLLLCLVNKENDHELQKTFIDSYLCIEKYDKPSVYVKEIKNSTYELINCFETNDFKRGFSILGYITGAFIEYEELFN